MECGVESVTRGVVSVKSEEWSVECEVRSGERKWEWRV